MLGRSGNIVMIAALLSFVFGETHRRKVEIFAAWTTIYTAHGQPGSDRRIEALEFLNSRPPKFPWIGLTKKDWYWDSWRGKCVERLWGLRWERETLDGLSVGLSNETNQNRVYLEGIKLCGAKLNGANFQSAHLKKAKLQSAHLVRANLQSAHLREAKLQSAHLVRANLQSAELRGANLQSAVLINVKNLTPKQIKSSCNWKQALFKAEWNGKKQIWKAVEPNNTDFIKAVAEDKASNPKNSPDCSLWNKQE